MYLSVVFLVSLITATSCQFHLNKNGASLLCPDLTSRCSNEDTCCKLKNIEGYGCCPQPQAECCTDHVHCCPHGYGCSDSNMCVKGDLTAPMIEQRPISIIAVLTKQPSKMNPDTIATTFRKQPAIKAPQNIICPDGRSQCASNNTCCPDQSGGYGCCSFPNAVCCSDKQHCCALGYSCNTDGTCTQQHVVCPDQSTICPLNNTCCLLPSREYSCCPLPYATCCSDGDHCCALGYSCNTDGTCTRQNIVCPNQKTTCPLNNTCCLLLSGDYGCCPLPNAVCCSNEKCCPSGQSCNTDGTCSAEYSISPIFKKQSAKEGSIDAIYMKQPTQKYSITAMAMKQPAVKAPQNIICPDGKSECASNNTCCLNLSGEYGCCPQLNAVCCSDRQHCCPIGYSCDIGEGTCTKVNVVCPDQSSLCPLGNTCCLLASGVYGCCPNPNAVCCSDGKHCCPEGYTCDTSAGTCIQGGTFISISTSKTAPCPNRNQPATRLSQDVNTEQGDLL